MRPGADGLLVVFSRERVHEIVDHLVDDVDGTAVDIEQDVGAVLLKFMDFRFHSFSSMGPLPRRGRLTHRPHAI